MHQGYSFSMRFLLLLLLLPLLTFAHGDSPSLEAEVGKYLIDIGYEALSPGEPVTFDLDLYETEPSMTYAAFASVDVRVSREGAEIQAGSVENDGVHVPVFTVLFPEPGGYDVDVRYLDADAALIVARTFHLEVPSASRAILREGFMSLSYVIAALLLALSLGIGGYSLWEKYRSPRR